MKKKKSGWGKHFMEHFNGAYFSKGKDLKPFGAWKITIKGR